MYSALVVVETVEVAASITSALPSVVPFVTPATMRMLPAEAIVFVVRPELARSVEVDVVPIISVPHALEFGVIKESVPVAACDPTFVVY